jgi:hypothetical protein
MHGDAATPRQPTVHFREIWRDDDSPSSSPWSELARRCYRGSFRSFSRPWQFAREYPRQSGR